MLAHSAHKKHETHLFVHQESDGTNGGSADSEATWHAFPLNTEIHENSSETNLLSNSQFTLRKNRTYQLTMCFVGRSTDRVAYRLFNVSKSEELTRVCNNRGSPSGIGGSDSLVHWVHTGNSDEVFELQYHINTSDSSNLGMGDNEGGSPEWYSRVHCVRMD